MLGIPRGDLFSRCPALSWTESVARAPRDVTCPRAIGHLAGMRSSFLMLVVLLTVTACGGHVGADPSAGVGADAASAREDAPSAADASLVDSSSDDVAALDAVADMPSGIDVLGDSVCPADIPPDIEEEPGEVPIQASIVGPNVNATLCTNAYVAYEIVSTTSDNSFVVNGNLAGYPPGFPRGNPPIALVLPMDAVGGSLSADIPISASAPATYESDAGTCGSVQFLVEFPVPPSVDCDSGVIGSNGCPDGCVEYGHGRMIYGCAPEYPTIEYSASDECDGQAGQGSYTLTIASPEPLIEGNLLYAPLHGALNATAVNVDGGTDTVEVQATF